MRKLIFALLLLVPCLAYSQDDDSTIHFVSGDSLEPSFAISWEQSYMTSENWLSFTHPQLGSVLISDLGYIVQYDSSGKSVQTDVPCAVYPILKESIDAVYNQEYFWFSQKHFDHKIVLQREENLKKGNGTYFATVNGKEFTCNASPEYVLHTYMKTFNDVLLVAKLPKDKGVVVTHN